MARIAFILLCHKGPGAIIRQAGKLTAAGDYIAIHFDAHSPQADFEEIFEFHNSLMARKQISIPSRDPGLTTSGMHLCEVNIYGQW